MLRFVMGAVVAGVVIWVWGDDLGKGLEKRTRVMRAKAADQLKSVQKATETTLDAAKERISSGLQSGQDALRPGAEKVRAMR
jgi:hypothetical protein